MILYSFIRVLADKKNNNKLSSVCITTMQGGQCNCSDTLRDSTAVELKGLAKYHVKSDNILLVARELKNDACKYLRSMVQYHKQ